ncbi:MAG: hypothetical protein WA632_13900 [Gallionella sp.]
MSNDTNMQRRIYRLDRFVVPNGVREEFLGMVKATHEVLKAQPGFVQDFILEQPRSDQAFNLATLVEWQHEIYTVNARAVVAALHLRIGFDKQEFLARAGIKAEFGSYSSLRN